MIKKWYLCSAMQQTRHSSSPLACQSQFFDGISTEFTDIKKIYQSDCHVVVRAKRYDRWWALKFLNPDKLDSEECLRQLVDEFKNLVRLQHPGIVETFSMESVCDLGPCIVMEYIDGSTLTEWLKTKPAKSARIDVARQITEAVAWLHSKGIAHRGLLPENIMVTRADHCAKLIDLGTGDADMSDDILSLGKIFKLMKIGRPLLVKKCCQPPERRFRSIKPLQRTLNRQLNMMRNTLFLCLAFFIVGMIALIIAQTKAMADKRLPEMPRTFSEQKNMRMITADSVDVTALYATIHALSDSIENLSAANRLLLGQSMNEDSERIRIENATKVGYEMIDRTFVQLGLPPDPDSISDVKMLPSDYEERMLKIYPAIQTFPTKYYPGMSSADATEIIAAMRKYAAEKCNRIRNRAAILANRK